MTICYTKNVATCGYFGCFLPLLFRWRGSIYKLVWLDLISFLSLYYALNLSYRFVLDNDQKVVFENCVQYCSDCSLIPISFVLGFYVSIVMGRWWAQYLAIPWPDSIAVYVSAHIQGHDERGRLLRRTIMRYVCLCLTMVFTYVSYRVKKRFPTWDYLVEVGLLLENEKVIIKRLDTLFPNYPLHWLPIVWSASIVKRARKEGRIRDDFAVKTIIDELNKFRGSAGFVLFYDFISVPLVYTQVVTLAVYSYFIFQIVGCQYLGKVNSAGYYDLVDKYFPVFATLEFFFYMGWLKVAESLINPFGDDDDDFEVNWLIDRNLQVSYLIVDEMHNEHPELVRDQFWDQVFPSEIRYSVNIKIKREEPPEPSTAKVAADYVITRSTGNIVKRASHAVDSELMKDNEKDRVPVKFRSLIPVDNSSSGQSRTSKQIGVVTPLNIPEQEGVQTKSQPQSASAVDIDDFEALRRKREAERLQRHTRLINRTVLDLQGVTDSGTVIQLVPSRSLVITESETSFVHEILFGQQEEEPAVQQQEDEPTSKKTTRVKITEPMKRVPKSHHKKKKDIERALSVGPQTQVVPKLIFLARKAHEEAEKASRSRAAANLAEVPRTSTISQTLVAKPSATALIYDSEGSISFTDVQDEGNESQKVRKQDEPAQKHQDRDESEASTLFSDASDEPANYERPELFVDERDNIDVDTAFTDAGSETVTQKAADIVFSDAEDDTTTSKKAADTTFSDVEDETGHDMDTDESKKEYKSPTESDKDKKNQKKKDKRGKRR